MMMERARDHHTNRLDTEEFDALLATDAVDASEDLLRRFGKLIAKAFAEG